MRNKLAIGATVVAATAGLSLAVNSIDAGQLPGNPIQVSPAAAAELEPFAGCDALLSWYIDEALPDVGPYGLGGWPYALPYAVDGTTALAEATAGVRDSTDPATQSSETGTNVQEAGVDEPDRAKTNGELVVHLRGQTLVVTDVTGATVHEVGTLKLPRNLISPELLLIGDTVLVTGAPQQRWFDWRPIVADGPWGLPMQNASSRLIAISVADPASPTVTSDRTLSGSLVSTRQYADVVRMVVQTGAPTIDWVQPNRRRDEQEAETENRRFLQESTIADWLPTVETDGGNEQPLVDCADVLHPTRGGGYTTTTVVTFAASDPSSLTSTALTSRGSVIYSSTDRLYLTTSPSEKRTQVHAFALDGLVTTYVASGEVDGTVKDRWSFDEQDGYLRVAASYGSSWNPEHNGIEVLRETDGELEVVGSVQGLGPEEQIKSVRWYDDLAVVVTFRQTDPLYTVDLSDPAQPRTLGELKIDGFSAYLHPIGDGLILGVGSAATKQGRVTGGQASVFDLSDLAEPKRLDVLSLGRHEEPVVAWETRAFTWLPDRRTALTPIMSWRGTGELVALSVTEDGHLAESSSWDLAGGDAHLARTLPLSQGGVVLVTDTVRFLDLS